MNAVNGLEIRLFADDTALYVHGKDIGRIFNQMRDGLSKLKEWFACNRLTLNFLKTCYSIYHGQRRKIPRMYDRMNISGHSIFRQKTVKYLGLMIDDILNWDDHIYHLVRSLSKFLAYLTKSKHWYQRNLSPWYIMHMYSQRYLTV